LFVGVTSVGNDPNWQDGGGLRAYVIISKLSADLTVAKVRKNWHGACTKVKD
jgi:hypothetical protein